MDPRRLLDGDAGALEQTLLRAAKRDQPASDARHRAAIAIGLATGAAAATTAGTAAAGVLGAEAASGAAGAAGVTGISGAAGAAGAAGAGAAAKVASAGGAIVVAKWIGIGLATSAIAVTAVRATVTHEPEAIAVHVAPAPSAPRAPEPLALPPVAVAAPASLDPPAPSTAPPAPTRAPAPSIGEEVALLDRARAALAEGDPERTSRLLDQHARAFRGGALGPEAAVIRIDALVAMGDERAAFALATRFLAAHPDGPLSRHVRAVADRLGTNR
jgi:hypothetical protein